MTEKLFYIDPYRKTFEATVLFCTETDKGYEIILDRTAFYPEGGGQPCDFGTLGDAQVLDVQDREGEVIHFCNRALLPGQTVQGTIDWDRRFLFMQQHSGEHIFSGIAHALYGCENIGFHMGHETVTVDLSRVLTEKEISLIEQKTNQLIVDNVEILISYPKPEELAVLAYRSKKELTGQVRIVTIPGGDICACCGTHVKQTGEIGMVKVVSTEHYKSGIRLELKIGQAAFYDYLQKHESIRQISQMLSSKPDEVVNAVEKLKNQITTLKAENMENRKLMLETMTASVHDSDKLALLFIPGSNMQELCRLADSLGQKAVFTALFSGTDMEGYKYVLYSKTEDVISLGRKMNQELNGRGGGRPPMTQGSVACTRGQIQNFFENLF